MNELKLRLLIDAVQIEMKRAEITAEEALGKYPALPEDIRSTILAAMG